MEDKHKKAWQELIKRLDGYIDGLESAAEEGAQGANRELQLLKGIKLLVSEIAENNNVENLL